VRASVARRRVVERDRPQALARSDARGTLDAEVGRLRLNADVDSSHAVAVQHTQGVIEYIIARGAMVADCDRLVADVTAEANDHASAVNEVGHKRADHSAVQVLPRHGVLIELAADAQQQQLLGQQRTASLDHVSHAIQYPLIRP